jgi:hypothetical protein
MRLKAFIFVGLLERTKPFRKRKRKGSSSDHKELSVNGIKCKGYYNEMITPSYKGVNTLNFTSGVFKIIYILNQNVSARMYSYTCPYFPCKYHDVFRGRTSVYRFFKITSHQILGIRGLWRFSF